MCHPKTLDLDRGAGIYALAGLSRCGISIQRFKNLDLKTVALLSGLSHWEWRGV